MRIVWVGMMIGLLHNPAWGSGTCFGLLADSVSVNEGDTFELRIRAIHFDSIVSFQGTITFDSSVAGLISVSQYGLPGMGPGNFNLSAAAQGWMTFVWSDPDADGKNIPDTADLFTLKLYARGQAGNLSPVRFSSDHTPLEAANFTLNVIPVCADSGQISIQNPGTGLSPGQLSGCGKSLSDQLLNDMPASEAWSADTRLEGFILPLDCQNPWAEAEFLPSQGFFEWKMTLQSLPLRSYLVSLGPANCRASFKLIKY